MGVCLASTSTTNSALEKDMISFSIENSIAENVVWRACICLLNCVMGCASIVTTFVVLSEVLGRLLPLLALYSDNLTSLNIVLDKVSILFMEVTIFRSIPIFFGMGIKGSRIFISTLRFQEGD